MITGKKAGVMAATLLTVIGLAGCSSKQESHEVSGFSKGLHRTSNEIGREIRHRAIRRGVTAGERKLEGRDTKDGKLANSGTLSSESKTADYKTLADVVYKPGTNPVIQVNHDKSTLDASTWKNEKLVFSPLDKLNRTGSVTAYLSKRNLGRSEGRDPQTWNSTGWHNQAKRVNGKRVFPQNRGHLIAYTLTFNFDKKGNYSQGKGGSLDNPYNLATQSAFGNQKPMQDYSENLVRNALEKGKHVVYKVTPVFKGNDLMSIGYWVQAKSTDGSLNFNRFILNVQPGIKFNYATGTSSVDPSMTIPYKK